MVFLLLLLFRLLLLVIIIVQYCCCWNLIIFLPPPKSRGSRTKTQFLFRSTLLLHHTRALFGGDCPWCHSIIPLSRGLTTTTSVVVSIIVFSASSNSGISITTLASSRSIVSLTLQAQYVLFQIQQLGHGGTAGAIVPYAPSKSTCFRSCMLGGPIIPSSSLPRLSLLLSIISGGTVSSSSDCLV